MSRMVKRVLDRGARRWVVLVGETAALSLLLALLLWAFQDRPAVAEALPWPAEAAGGAVSAVDPRALAPSASQPQAISRTLPSLRLANDVSAEPASAAVKVNKSAKSTQVLPQCVVQVSVTKGLAPVNSLSSQPAVNALGDQVAFWSTGDLTKKGTNSDGNIEIFVAGMNASKTLTLSQVTSSTGSILGGLNYWPTLDATGKRVAFFSDRDLSNSAHFKGSNRNPDANFEVFMADIDYKGTVTVTQITSTTGGVNVWPALSGDGASIVFATDRNPSTNKGLGAQEIYLASNLGGTVTFRRITTSADGVMNDRPAVDLDGTRVAFRSTGRWDPASKTIVAAAGAEQIMIANLDASAVTIAQVTNDDSYASDQPSLSYDGARLAFQSFGNLAPTSSMNNADHSQEVFWAQIGSNLSSTLVQATDDGTDVSNEQASMSGEGEFIGYMSNDSVMLYNVAYGTRAYASSAGGGGSRPSVSDDGGVITFASDGDIYKAFCPLADFSISKTATPNPSVPGKPITYTIRVDNPSLQPATGATVIDTIPIGIDSSSWHWTCTALGGTCGTSSGTKSIHQSIDIQPGGALTYTAVGTVWYNATLPMTNTAVLTVPVNTVDMNPTNNIAQVIVRSWATADLAIGAAASANPIVAGDSFQVTLAFTNTGPSTAHYITITDILPAGVTYGALVSASPAGVRGPTVSGQTLVWTLSDLDPQGKGTYTGKIVFSATMAPNVQTAPTNNVAITSGSEDPVSANNSVGQTLYVTSHADLAVTKSGSPSIILSGNKATYAITVRNNGPSYAWSAALADALSGTGTLGTPTTSVGSCVPATNGATCAFGALAPNAQATVSLPFTLSSAGHITDTATASSTSTDTDTSNNSAKAYTWVASPGLAIDVAATPATIYAGNPATFTIAITNTGDITLTNIAVSDTDVTACAKSGMTLTAGHSTSYTCSTPGTLLANLTNRASAVGTVYYVGSTVSAADSATVTVIPNADLGVLSSPSATLVLTGTTVVYTATVTNSGPSPASTVYVTNTLTADATASATFKSASSTLGSCSNLGNGKARCGPATIAKNVSRTAIFTYTVPTTGTLTSTLTTGSATVDLNASNNSATNTLRVIGPRIKLGMVASPKAIYAGEAASFTIAITNTGDVTITGITVGDPVVTACETSVPAATLVPWHSMSYTCSTPAGQLSDVENTATVTGTSALIAKTVTSSASATVSVTPVANLAVQSVPSATSVVTNSLVTYSVVVTNAGPSPAVGVVMTGTMTPDATSSAKLVSTAIKGGTCSGTIGSGGPVYCELGDISASHTATATLVYRVPTTGTITGTVSVGSATLDRDTSDNSQSHALFVAGPGIRLGMEPAAQTIDAGSAAHFTIAITNTGNVTLTGVTVTDPLVSDCDLSTAIQLAPWAKYSYSCTRLDLLDSFTNAATVAGTAALVDKVVSAGASAEVTVTPVADLALANHASATALVKNETITYTLVITNHGASTAQGVVLTNTLTYSASSAPQLESVTRPTGGTCRDTSSGANPVICDLASLAANQTVTFVLTYKMPATGTYTDTARVGSLTADRDTSNNSQSQHLRVVNPGLAMDKVPVASPIYAGGAASFRIAITNTGDITVTGLVVTDAAVPACASGLPTTSLAAGANTSYTCSTASNQLSDVSNSASVQGTASLVNTTVTASGAATVVVIPVADLAVASVPSATTALTDTLVTYHVAVTNTGPSTAAGVVVTATMAPDATGTAALVTKLTNSGTCYGTVGTSNPVTCTLGSLAAGSSVTATLAYQLPTTGTLTNTVTAASSTLDLDGSDNSVANRLRVISPRLTLAMTGTQTVFVNDTIYYTLTVKNTGDITMTNLSIADTDVSGCAQSRTALAAGATWTVTCNTSHSSAGTYTNQATVSGRDALLNTLKTAQASVSTTVESLQQLSISKTASKSNAAVGDSVRYTMTVTNLSPNHDTNNTVTFKDTFGSGSAACTAASSPCTCSTLSSGCGLGKIGRSGGSKTVTATFTLNAAGTYTNTATTHTSTNGFVADSSTTATVKAYNPSIAVGILPATQTILAGADATFTVAITNTGDLTLSSIGVVDTPHASCGSLATTTLASGEHTTYSCTLSGQLTSGSYGVTATGTAALLGVTRSSSATAAYTVTPVADLALAGKATATTAIVGAHVSYAYTLTNHGPSAASSVRLTDTLAFGGGASATLSGTATKSMSCSGTNPVICTLTGSLASGSATTATLTYALTAGGTLTNTAAAGSATLDTATADNTVSHTLRILTPGLAVDVVPQSASVNAGSTATFDVAITNTGTVSVTGLALTPSTGSCVAPAATQLSPAGHVATTCSVASVSDTFTFTVEAKANEIVSNSQVTASDSAVQTVTPVADLALAGKATATTAIVGAHVSYAYTLTNHGPSTATSVRLTDTLAFGGGAGASLYASASKDMSCSGSPLVCSLTGSLASGSATTATLTYALTAGGTLTNTAAAGSATLDTATADNTVSHTLRILTPGLAVDVVPQSPNVNAGSTATFDVAITNTGTVSVTGLALTPSAGSCTDPSPTELSPAGHVATTCSVASVSDTFTFTVEAKANEIVSNSQVTASDSAQQTVTPVADLALAGKATATTAIVGAHVSYAYTLTNHGPSTATSVRLTDTLAFGGGAGASLYASASKDMSCSGSPLVCSLTGSLASGSATTATLTYSLSAGGTLTNTAAAGSAVLDGSASNDTVSHTLRILTPGLAVDVVPQSPNVNAGSTATFDVAITNTGTVSVTGLALTPSAGSCTDPSPTELSPAGHVATTCSVASVTGTFTFTVEAKANEIVSNSQVTASDSAVQTVTPVADLALDGKATATTAIVGAHVSYAYTLTNHGPSTASSVRLTDTLAFGGGAGASLYTSTSKDMSCSGSPLVCSLTGSLASGSATTATLTYALTAGGTLTNTAAAGSATLDTATADNTVSHTLRILTPGLAVDVVPQSASVVSGSTATFDVAITNTGTVSVTGLALTPSAGSCVAPAATELSPAGHVATTCSVASVTGTFTFTVEAKANEIVSNTTVTTSDSAVQTVTGSGSLFFGPHPDSRYASLAPPTDEGFASRTDAVARHIHSPAFRRLLWL